MSNRKFDAVQSTLTMAIAIACTLGVAACSSGPSETAALPTKQGTIALEALKIGMPESSIKDALMTFAEDPKGAFGGKTQYLSRAYDANGGQYVVQCKDGKVYGIQVYLYKGTLPKETAMKVMHQLLPAAATEFKVDDTQIKDAKVAQPTEKYNFADGSTGELVYSDRTLNQVGMINAWLPTETAVGTTGGKSL